MTQETPTFDISEFELRGYTNPYLTPTQQTQVAETEIRVNSQLNFLAQMLGWNGPNYWGNLPSTVNQKRQLLGGSFGVYNSYVIPKIYEIRNWDNKIVIDRLQFLQPGRQTQVERILLGNNVYSLESVESEGDKYVISIGELDQEFFDLIAANEPLRADIPTYRPAPFNRSAIGISGDSSFVCAEESGELVLYPSYDTQKKFPFKFPIFFIGAYYYFNQPVYLSTQTDLTPFILPEYDSERELWYFQIPTSLTDSVGLTPSLVLANSNSVVANNVFSEIKIVNWTDPSDWGSTSVLDNFKGVWGNKGGDLPFNFVFDALSIHGFSERNSLFFKPFSASLNFNDIVNFIYYQKTVISELAPGDAEVGDLWWNDNTGVLAAWLPGDSGCGGWVEIDYRNSPTQQPAPTLTFADMGEFRAAASTISDDSVVRIIDISGLTISDGVVGVQSTLTAAATLTLHHLATTSFWIPDVFYYDNVIDFESDALALPYKVPVNILNATGLGPETPSYKVSNLPIVVAGAYATVLLKYYTNDNWELYPDSILKYIADSALVGSPVEGQMWWDFDNPEPTSRAASIRYQNTWVELNSDTLSGPPAPSLDLGVVLFYCNGTFMTEGIATVTEDFSIVYTQNVSTGQYEFAYTPYTLKGQTQLPVITISDSITTVYRADISDLLFSGVTYYMSPNVYNAESPLRLWKAQALQVVETVAHLEEDNYINPLLADLNNGPGPENWERYFVRLPLEYERNGSEWQKVALVCQDFGYWGSPVDPEKMRCPPEDDVPAIYEELFLYDSPVPDYTYVYSEPYLYSNVAYFNSVESGQFQNSGVFPASDVQFDEFSEAQFIGYEPLHNRQADVTSPVKGGYGDWLGQYVNVNPCIPLTGFFTTDLLSRGIEPVLPPVWDASIYKFAPTCENAAASYNVDANHYKIGYAYFVADASAAEEACFDITQEAAWRYPVTQPRTLYLTPR
jgi:hypothetical protein